MVIFHGLIPHHHHDDLPVDIEIAHVHEASLDNHSHHNHSHHGEHTHSEEHNHHHNSYADGLNIAEGNLPCAHHHNHFHVLSNGFTHIERSISELKFDDTKELSLQLLFISANDLGRYYCRDDCGDFVEQDIACPSRLFNNIKALRGPPYFV